MSVATPPAGVRYEAVIGIEIHCQLKTASKMFCGCSTDYAARRPTPTCARSAWPPGDAAGASTAARSSTCCATGLAIGATDPRAHPWERKNYFYPDLPKGYQISQYDLPLAAARAR